MTDTLGQPPDASSAQVVIEVSAFANYLRRVVPVLLEDGDDTPAALVVALKEKNAIECMKKFLSDPQVSVLYIQRSSTKGTRVFFCSWVTYFENWGRAVLLLLFF